MTTASIVAQVEMSQKGLAATTGLNGEVGHLFIEDARSG
jgi:hypothetical protein